MRKVTVILIAFLFATHPIYGQTNSSKSIYVEIPYELKVGIPVIDVLINGKPFKFVLDTGAPKTYIARRVVDQSSLKLKKKVKTVRDTNGVSKQQPIAVIKDMIIGGISYSTSEAMVSEDDSYLFSCYGFDGIIGGDFLKRFVVKFDSRAKVVTLTTDVSRVVSDEQVWQKMFLVTSKPFCYIKAKENAYNSYLFDSGCGLSSIHLDTVRYNAYKQRNTFEFTDEEAGYGATSVGIHGERVKMKRYRATITEFNFGGHTFYDVPVETTRSPKIGFVIANFGDVILDYPRKRYCFIPHQSDTAWLDSRDKAGCAVKDSGLVISVIWDKELAKQVAVGDKLIMIGNQRFDNVDRCYRAKFSSLIETHITPDNNTLLLEKPDGAQYTLPANVFL